MRLTITTAMNEGVCAAVRLVHLDDRATPALFDSTPPSLAFLVAQESLPRDRFRAADLAASAHVAPMPAPGAEVFVAVEGTWVRVTADPSNKEQ